MTGQIAALIYLTPVVIAASFCAIIGLVPRRSEVFRVVLWPVFLMVWAAPNGFWIWRLCSWVSRQARFVGSLVEHDISSSERMAERDGGDR